MTYTFISSIAPTSQLIWSAHIHQSHRLSDWLKRASNCGRLKRQKLIYYVYNFYRQTSLKDWYFVIRSLALVIKSHVTEIDWTLIEAFLKSPSPTLNIFAQKNLQRHFKTRMKEWIQNFYTHCEKRCDGIATLSFPYPFLHFLELSLSAKWRKIVFNIPLLPLYFSIAYLGVQWP